MGERELLDYGHVTVIHFKDGYRLTFDFQYNKQPSGQRLKVVQHFLKTTKFALENKFTHAFLDNDFSTLELLAKTNLLLEANRSKSLKSHKSIQTAYNLRFKNSTTQFEIDRRKILNKLSGSRNNARYLH